MVYSTAENIKCWEILLNMPDIPQYEKERVKLIISKMKKHDREFVSMGEDETDTFDQIYTFPRKVIVLINKGCGSTDFGVGSACSDSIAGNIAVDAERIDDERQFNAIKIANVHEYITKLPEANHL